MALSRAKVWVSGETLTAADLNAEFQNIIDNATSLISPLGGALDWDGYAHTLDAAGVTTAQSTSAIGWSFTPGSKAGTPGTTGSISNWAANTYTDNNTANSGTAATWTGHSFQRPTLAASNTSVVTTDAATVYIANSPLAGTNETLTNAWSLWVDNGGVRFDSTLRVDGAATFNSTVAGTPTGAMAPAGHLFGLTMTNGSDATNDIDIAAGECVSDDTTPANRVIMTLSSSITKQLDASWAVGTNAGGRATGVAIANSTYHVFVIYRSDTGVTDVAFDTSVTGANIATNTNAAYTKKRRIGSILRESAAIVAFTQDGDYFRRSSAVLDINANNPGTSAVTATLSVPTGVAVQSIVNADVADGGAGTDYILYLSDLASTDAAPSHTVAPLSQVNNSSRANSSGWAQIRTNTSAQIRYRINTSSAAVTVRLATLGWLDQRGRLN